VSARKARRTRVYVPSAERRVQILEAAADLFSRRGFAGTTTREIAAAVGTSETVLFRHFSTKERLYAAILEHRLPAAGVERWLDELRRLADARDDEALFTAVVQAILDSYRTHAVYHRLMLFAALESHELARSLHATYSAPLAGFLRQYVASRQADGALRRLRPELVVHMLLSPATNFAQWRAFGINTLGLSDADVITQAMTLLAGLRNHTGPVRRRRRS